MPQSTAQTTHRLTIENVGPIKKADITFGDLTVFVGPQASGKSIVFQLLKLIVDKSAVHAKMREAGLNWKNRIREEEQRRFFNAYFGEGMASLFSGESRLSFGDTAIKTEGLSQRPTVETSETVFLIPAQRVSTLKNGWPRAFSDYSPGDPFTVRDFSEKLRLLVEDEFSSKSTLFPQRGRLKEQIRLLINKSVFGGFKLEVETDRYSQSRFVLKHGDDARTPNESLPPMVWSAGQREFVPLLLGLYWLMPPTKVPRRAALKWAIIEEPEMGLHTKAITAVLAMVLDLLKRGYRVCIATHSPQVLDAVWAVRNLATAKADPKALLAVFDLPASPELQKVATEVLGKDLRVYAFDTSTREVSDISNLDPDAASPREADWGGLASFSERANREVAKAVSQEAARAGAPK
jgi:hypothetical protein